MASVDVNALLDEMSPGAMRVLFQALSFDDHTMVNDSEMKARVKELLAKEAPDVANSLVAGAMAKRMRSNDAFNVAVAVSATTQREERQDTGKKKCRRLRSRGRGGR